MSIGSRNYAGIKFDISILTKEVLTYQGVFSMALINGFISDIRSYLASQGIEKRTIKGFHSLAVECLENVHKHGVSTVEGEQKVLGDFVFGHDNKGLVFTLSNLVSPIDANRLETKLSSIKGLELADIKLKYRHELVNGSISERGGAGLGIYVMALKSNNNYEYTLNPVEDGFYDFTISFNVPL